MRRCQKGAEKEGKGRRRWRAEEDAVVVVRETGKEKRSREGRSLLPEQEMETRGMQGL